jgi:hypothetical protein
VLSNAAFALVGLAAIAPLAAPIPAYEFDQRQNYSAARVSQTPTLEQEPADIRLDGGAIK